MMNSEIPPVCSSPTTTTTVSQTDTTTDIVISTKPSGASGLSPGTRAGVVAFVIITVLIVVIAILVAVIVVQRKNWKAQKQAVINGNDNTYSSLTYNSKLSLFS